MRKLLAAALILILAGMPVLAGNITTFEHGIPESVAELYTPECNDTINITLPAECHVLNAIVNVSTSVPDEIISGYPDNASISLDGIPIWQFNETGFGAFGFQHEFINGTEDWTSKLGLDGGSNSTKLRLPKDAIIKSATMEITPSGHGIIEKYLEMKATAWGEWMGYTTSSAGDVNNDGYDDWIVGSPYYGGGYGRAYIYLGGPGFDNIADVVLTGSAGDLFGFSVAGAGDINNDGYDDVLVGAFWHDTPIKDAGSAYIFFGGKNMDSTADIVFSGSAVDEYFGQTVSSAGDVNSDGYGDIIISTNGYLSSSTNKVYIYLGGPAMDNKADVILTGEAAGDYFGNSVSSAGDVNNDGYDDVIVGAECNDACGSDAGRAYVYFGGTKMDNTIDVTLSGTAAGDYFGKSVSGTGDVNGDGYGDVVVGAYAADGLAVDAGKACIYFGGKSMDSIPDVVLMGTASYDVFGECVSGIGDLNRDGYNDVAVGASLSDAGGVDAGKVQIYYGGKTMDNISDINLSSNFGGERFGVSVSTAGDLDNDGFLEMVIGAFWNNEMGWHSGKAYIYKSPNGTKDPEVTVGTKQVWNQTGYCNKTYLSRDFASDLEGLLGDSPLKSDKYGNKYVEIPVKITTKSEGILTIDNLKIEYTVETKVPEFRDRLNSYIAAHRAEQDANGNLTVPFKIASSTLGKLMLTDLNIKLDNAPSLIRPIPNFFLDEDSVKPDIVDLTQYFEDDYDNKADLTYAIVSKTNETIVDVQIVNNCYISADSLTGDANNDWTGEVTVVVAVTDHYNSKRVSNPFKIIVRNVNDPPKIIIQSAPTGIGGVEYLYQVLAVDVDNDTLTYELSKKPTNMTIDESSGLIRWGPDKWGTYDVTVAVGDGIATVTQSFNIIIANRPPRMTNDSVPVAYVDQPYVFAIQATDDDGDSLTYSLLDKPGAMTLDENTGNLTWLPNQVGEFSVSVSISDRQDSITSSFTIKVVQGNRLPKFSSNPINSAFVGIPYGYDSNATDGDGDLLVFEALEIPAGMTLDKSTGKLDWIPSTAGKFNVKIGVFDGKGGQAVQEFTITVMNRTRPKIEFSQPPDDQTVEGALAVTGKVTKGTLKVVNIQLRIDTGEWINVTSTSTWTYTLDTTKLKNGKHTLQARAYDGMDYSDTVNRTITVDNQKAAGKGFIPGFAGILVPVVVAAACVLLGWRRKANR